MADFPMIFDERGNYDVAANEQKYLNAPLEEISHEDFWERLEILPPMDWRACEGGERFLICEAMTGDVYQQIARINLGSANRYFKKYVRRSDTATYITVELVEAFDASKG